MKNCILLMVALISSLVSFAQVSVDSIGDVKVSGTMVAGARDLKTTLHKSGGVAVIGYYNAELTTNLGSVKYFWGGGYESHLSGPTRYAEKFSVRADGTIYTDKGVIQTSDASAKKNITALAFPMEAISALRGVSFDYASKPATRANNVMSDSALMKAYGAETVEIARQMQSEESRKRIGLIAQEVESVLPDVVRTLPDGHKGILYSDLIGVLVEGLKEVQDSLASQARVINELKALLTAGNGNSSRNKVPANAASNNGNLYQIEPELFQNLPNPFTETTEIRYRIPQDSQSAILYIYNMNGKQIDAIVLTQKGDGKITLQGSTLEAGMYLYALMIDNKQIDVKRMILTK